MIDGRWQMADGNRMTDEERGTTNGERRTTNDEAEEKQATVGGKRTASEWLAGSGGVLKGGRRKGRGRDAGSGKGAVVISGSLAEGWDGIGRDGELWDGMRWG